MKKMNTKFFTISLLFISIIIGHKISLAKVIVITYDDLPSYVKKSNKKVKSKHLLIKSKKSQTNHLIKSFLPEVSASGGYESFQTGDLDLRTEPKLNLEARVNLFRSGKDILEDKIRRDKYEISKYNLQNEYLRQLLISKELFWESYYFKKKLEAINKISTDLIKLSNQAQKKLKSGLILQSEINAIQIFSDQLQTETILLEEDYEHGLDELKVALGIQLTDKIELRAPKKHQHSVSIKENPIKHPALDKIKKEISISEKQRKKHNLWWTPSIDAFGAYNLHTFREREFFDQSDRDEYVGGIQIKMNLFDKLSSSSKSRSEKYKTLSLKSEMEHLHQELEAIVKKLEHGLKVRHQLIHKSKKSFNLSQKLLSQTKEEFQNGIKNSTDMISAYEMFLYRSEKYETFIKDYYILEAQLLALIDDRKVNIYK